MPRQLKRAEILVALDIFLGITKKLEQNKIPIYIAEAVFRVGDKLFEKVGKESIETMVEFLYKELSTMTITETDERKETKGHA